MTMLSLGWSAVSFLVGALVVAGEEGPVGGDYGRPYLQLPSRAPGFQ